MWKAGGRDAKRGLARAKRVVRSEGPGQTQGAEAHLQPSLPAETARKADFGPKNISAAKLDPDAVHKSSNCEPYRLNDEVELARNNDRSREEEGEDGLKSQSQDGNV